MYRMESSPSSSENQPRAPKSRLVKIVDVPFSSIPGETSNGTASGKAEDGTGVVIKEETMDGLAKSLKDRTLRRVLLNRDEVLTVERLLVSESLLDAMVGTC